MSQFPDDFDDPGMDIPEVPQFMEGIGVLEEGKPKLQWFTSQAAMDAATKAYDEAGSHWEPITEENAAAWFDQNSPLADVQQRKLSEILAGANVVFNALNAKYSEVETELFLAQEKGARDLLADSKSTTDEANRVKALAEVNGEEVAAFAQKIVDKADAARDTKWTTLDEQQSMEAAVKAATSVAAVLAIEVKYTHAPVIEEGGQ